MTEFSETARSAPPEGTWLVIPAFNEEEVIARVLGEVLFHCRNVVVVDDGSADRTAEVSRRFPVHLLRHPINLGQGAALQTGITYALSRGAEVVVTFDADGQMDPGEIGRLREPLIRGEADVALGTRFASGTPEGIGTFRRWMLRAAIRFTRLGSRMKVTDTHNGFRALTRRGAESIALRQPRMAHATELLHQIAASRLNWCEVPVSIRYTDYSRRKGQSTFEALNILWELFFR